MSRFRLSAFADESAADIAGQIDVLQRNKINFIEMRNVDGKSIIDQGTKRVKEIALRLKANGIGVSAIGSPIGKISIADPFEPHIEAFRRTIEAAHLLGSKRIRLFSFFLPKGVAANECRGMVLERMEKLICLAETEDVFCCHENEKGIYGSTKENCLDLYHFFGKRLRSIFDPANFIQCGEEPEKIFEELLPFTDYLHIKDALLSDGSVVPPGSGDAELGSLLRQFAQTDGIRFLTLEPHLTVFAGFQNLKDEGHKIKFTYPTPEEAFDAASNAFKGILDKGGIDYE